MPDPKYEEAHLARTCGEAAEHLRRTPDYVRLLRECHALLSAPAAHSNRQHADRRRVLVEVYGILDDTGNAVGLRA